jgi:hypothetical protein
MWETVILDGGLGGLSDFILSSLSENVQLYHHATTKQVIGAGEPRQL